VSDAATSAPDPDDEVAEGELIPFEAKETPNPHAGALDRAAQAALDTPGIPGRDEFLSLAMQARMLSLSGAAPEAIRDDPYVAFHVAMAGRDLNLSPTAAMALIDVIKTHRGYQISMSPQLVNGQIARLGLGRIVPGERTKERAVAIAISPDGEKLGETEFTWEDAQDASLVGKQCQPGDHKRVNGKCGCNQGYITYPKRMLWWRAAGFCADDYFPEATLGYYSPEELGAVVDDEGRPIDPTQVELPPGYELPAGKGPASSAGEPAEYADIFWMKVIIAALPADAKAEFNTRWADVIGKVGPSALDKMGAKRAKAFIRGQVNNAEGVFEGQITKVMLGIFAMAAAYRCGSTAIVEPDPEPDAPTEATEADGPTPTEVLPDDIEDAVIVEPAATLAPKERPGDPDDPSDLCVFCKQRPGSVTVGAHFVCGDDDCLTKADAAAPLAPQEPAAESKPPAPAKKAGKSTKRPPAPPQDDLGLG
jgi:hypothetical protein